MKNIFYCFAVICLILGIIFFSFSAYSAAEKTQALTQENIARQLNKPFDSTADITYKGVHAKAAFNRCADGSFNIEFLQPSAVKGCVFNVKGEQISISHHGININLSTNEFLNSSAVKMAVKSINDALYSSGITLSAQDNSITLSGIGENGEFFLKLDSANGNLMSVEIPSSDFRMEFNDFKFIT
ncbi:MAG: hypothetical protein IKV41_01940 [Oscillospiraceae bacterium]|nr:hypothetical protein [Oscillospiraceae bacterium]